MKDTVRSMQFAMCKLKRIPHNLILEVRHTPAPDEIFRKEISEVKRATLKVVLKKNKLAFIMSENLL